MNTLNFGLIEGESQNETLYLVHRCGASSRTGGCLRSERPRLSEWRNGNLVRYALGFPLLNVTIWAAGIKLISDLMLPAAVCNGIGGAWTVAVLLPLAKVILAPAEGQGETIMRERFQVIQGGRTVLPTADDHALQNYIENYSTARNPEIAKVINIEIARRKAQGTWLRGARRMREERAA